MQLLNDFVVLKETKLTLIGCSHKLSDHIRNKDLENNLFKIPYQNLNNKYKIKYLH